MRTLRSGLCGTCGFYRKVAVAPDPVLLEADEAPIQPDEFVASEERREGDMIIARDEDGGVAGIFLVTAIMQRQAASVVYLTLEDAGGDTSVLGVTAEHPLHSGDDWVQAGDFSRGDLISDRAMLPLTVLAVRVDDTPQLVHNLEIGGAHTYFAGELDACYRCGRE